MKTLLYYYFFYFIFLVNEGFEDPNITKSGPSSARQRNADDGQTLNDSLVALCQGIRTSIAQKPYIFVIFQRGPGPPVLPPWIRTCFLWRVQHESNRYQPGGTIFEKERTLIIPPQTIFKLYYGVIAVLMFR